MSKNILIFQCERFMRKEEIEKTKEKIMKELDKGVVVLPSYVHLVYGAEVQDEVVVEIERLKSKLGVLGEE